MPSIILSLADEMRRPAEREGRFRARSLRHAILAHAPASLEEAAVSVSALQEALGELPVGSRSFARQVAPVWSALELLERFLAAAPALGDPRAGGSFLAAAADELEDTWRAYHLKELPILRARGDALERVILASPPNTVREAAVMADVALRWARDFAVDDAPRGTGVRLEACESGFESLSTGLHRLAQLPAPEDRPSFAIMVLNRLHES